MGRAEYGTPKWLSNKMKSKGLQRLRWYCQMCEKQCRDENGFKCHRMSEAHQRQMAVFSSRAGRYIDDFSRSFEMTFMQLMRTRYCRTKVLANTVYQDVISDKQHIHMNATQWTTLSEFVLYLQRTGKVRVEESDLGFVIEYIDKERMLREQQEAATRKALATATEQRRKMLDQQVKAAWKEQEKLQERETDNRQQDLPSADSAAVAAQSATPAGPVVVTIAPVALEETKPLESSPSHAQAAEPPPVVASVFGDGDDDEERGATLLRRSPVAANSCGLRPGKKLSAAEKLILEGLRK